MGGQTRHTLSLLKMVPEVQESKPSTLELQETNSLGLYEIRVVPILTKNMVLLDVLMLTGAVEVVSFIITCQAVPPEHSTSTALI